MDTLQDGNIRDSLQYEKPIQFVFPLSQLQPQEQQNKYAPELPKKDNYKKGFGEPDGEYWLGMIFNEVAVIPKKIWLKISIIVNLIRVIITT